jgi:uncharacterized protein (DUF885 family)
MKSMDQITEQYYNERMALFPLEATTNGDNRYNAVLPIDISSSYRDTLRKFYQKYLDTLGTVHRENLDESQQISYDILKWDLQTGLEDYPLKIISVPSTSFGAFR